LFDIILRQKTPNKEYRTPNTEDVPAYSLIAYILQPDKKITYFFIKTFLLFTLLFIFAQNKNMRNIIISVNLFILVLVLSQTS